MARVRSLSRALESASQTRSRLEKVAAIAAALSDAAARGEVELETCARIIVGRLLSPTDPRPLGVGFSIVLEAASLVRGVPEGWIAKRARELGDVGDGIAELISAPTHEAKKRVAQGVLVSDPRQLSLTQETHEWALPPEAERHRGLSLREVSKIVDALASTPSREGKLELVAAAIARATALDAKYFIKALLGELRVGVAGGIFEESLARAFDATIDTVRAAAAVEVDPGALALLASRRTLDTAQARIFHPVAFMLATPDESVAAPVEVAATIVEDKLDGVRAQLHVSEDGKVRLFARGQGDVSRSFPEVVAAFRTLNSAVILDGEILAIGTDAKPRPFQALQARLGRVDPEVALLESVPVHYFVFDILFDEGPVFSLPWRERRAKLDAFFARAQPTAASLVKTTRLSEDVPLSDALTLAYEAARSRGHEGIVLKRTDASYEAGRRGASWRKVKRAFATLDVVITAAERGHGRRAGVLSDYTFAVRDSSDSGEWLDVGKAYSGLTDVEIATMTERLEGLTLERRGALHRVRPTIVLEVAFDGIQRSKRHPSGFALRFPRIARIREDKTPDQADTLDAVRALFESQVASGHREDAKAPGMDARDRRDRRRRNGGGPQLGLFGAAKIDASAAASDESTESANADDARSPAPIPAVKLGGLEHGTTDTAQPNETPHPAKRPKRGGSKGPR